MLILVVARTGIEVMDTLVLDTLLRKDDDEFLLCVCWKSHKSKSKKKDSLRTQMHNTRHIELISINIVST